jgi:hypothetical protein
MIQRSQVPSVLVTALAVLTAGFALLAIFMSPEGADVAVQNGTGETFEASSFSLDLTSSVSSGPGTGTLSQERLITYTAPDHMVVYRISPSRALLGTLTSKAIKAVLAGYAAVTAGSTPWVRDGTFFERTESLVQFSARVSPTVPPERAAQGKVYETAIVSGGYLVYVNLHVIVPNQTTAGGQQAPGGVVGETFHLIKINGSLAPAGAP